MGRFFAYLSKTGRNIAYLFSVQWKIGVKGMAYQFLYAILNASKSLLWILFPKVLIDACIGGGDRNLFFVSLLGVSVVAWLIDLSIGITEVLQSVYNLKFAHFFKKKVAGKSMDLAYKETESTGTLDAIERAYEVAYELSGSQVADFLACLFKLAALVYIVSTLDAVAAAAALCVVIGIYAINKKAAERNHSFDRRKAPAERKKSYVEGRALDFGFAKDMRVFQCSEYMLRKYDAAAAQIQGIQKEQDSYNFAVSMAKSLLNVLLNGGIYVYLICCYSFGLVALSSFTMYLSAVAEFYGAIDMLFFMFADFYETNMNLDELEKYFSLSEMDEGGKGGDADAFGELRSIEFRDVSFTYPGQEKPALNHVSLKVSMGETVMLIGENGAGKSTFVKLLLGLYDADSGEILVNGVNRKKIPYPAYIRLFEPVFQEVRLFAYTVRENIAFSASLGDGGRMGYGRGMDKALEQSGALPLVGRLPDGLDTYCTKEFDESGYNFSGGESQMLSVARALYRCGKILVMDEPNSALDPVAERDLFTEIREMGKGKITVLISHKLAASKFSDHIYVFAEGSVIEEGSFGALMEKGGTFKELFDMQAVSYRQVKG